MRRRAALSVLAAAFGFAAVLPAAPASACVGTVCDAINAVCVIVRGGECIR